MKTFLTILSVFIIPGTCELYNDSIFVPGIENKYTNTTLNYFYDEFVVSFVILSNGEATTSIILISNADKYIIDINIISGDLIIIILDLFTFSITFTPNTWISIVISQLFINDNNIYNITVAVNGIVQYSNINTEPIVFTDAVLSTFVACSTRPDYNFGSIKNLSIYSKTQVIWTKWSDWSQCNASCYITRTRSCSNNLLLNCTGKSIEVESCTNIYQEVVLTENEFSLSEEKLIATLVKLNEEHSISFEIKPLDFIIYDLVRVIHLTVGDKERTYGYHTPSVWFKPNETQNLLICFAFSGDSKNGITAPLIPYTWSKVNLSQRFSEGKYNYSIQLNETIIFNEENIDVREFSNVKVYASYNSTNVQTQFVRSLKITNGNAVPWAQWNGWSSCNVSYGNGFMDRRRECTVSDNVCCHDNYELKECFIIWTPRNNRSNCNISYGLENIMRECIALNVMQWCYSTKPNTSNCTEVYLMKDKTSLFNGNLVTTIKKLEKEFSVYFEIQPTVFLNDFHSVIHFTTGVDKSSYGYRNPGVWFDESGDGALHICYDINNKTDQCYKTDRVKIGVWSSIKISQTYFQGTYIYTTELNGKMINNQQNSDAREFSNVKVYVSNLLHEAQIGFIRNLKINNGNSALWSNCRNWSSYSGIFGIMNKTYDCNITSSMKVCYGNNMEILECFDFWSNWSNWSNCNETYGFMNRTRECNNSSSVYGCYGNSSEIMDCFALWSLWSNWTSCNSSNGFINRTRACNSSNVMSQCFGNNSEVMECFVFWDQWSNWTGCDEFNIFMKRSRECKRLNTVDICIGNNSELMECPAYWSQWSSWTVCNASHGFVNRTRECKISNSRNWCNVNDSEIIECFASWAQWSNFISCGSSSGFVFKECKYSNVIDWCHGNNVETIEYFDKWTTWSECSVTCGLGNRSRYSQHEKIKVMKVENCYQINCPEDGMWGNWSRSECSSTCGNGIKFVNRSCDKPPPSYKGRVCIGVSNYTEVCDNDIICPINGNWSLWTSWSLCSQPCGGGLQSKFRSCSNPPPNFGGQDCNGSIEEFANCSMHYCKSIKLNLNLNFIDEEESVTLGDKIQNAIAKLYNYRRADFNVVIHSMESTP